MTNTVDPLGGSYFVEAFTNEMERQCYEYFDSIEEYGGVIPAIKAHFFQGEIARASYWYQHEIDEGRKTMVGVNKYVIEEPVEIPILEMDPKGEEKQREKLARLRAERDPQTLAGRPGHVRADSQGQREYHARADRGRARLRHAGRDNQCAEDGVRGAGVQQRGVGYGRPTTDDGRRERLPACESKLGSLFNLRNGI